MTEFLVLQPLHFGGRRYDQNDVIRLDEAGEAQHAAELDDRVRHGLLRAQATPGDPALRDGYRRSDMKPAPPGSSGGGRRKRA